MKPSMDRLVPDRPSTDRLVPDRLVPDRQTPDRQTPDRRQFALAAALSTAALAAGCHSEREPKPSREATLLHNERVRAAVAELEQAMNLLDMHMGQFNAENWQDTLVSAQSSTLRLRGDLEELKRALGYNDTNEDHG